MIATDLLAGMADARAALLRHPLYGALTSLPALHVFMANHVFAVWDFMTLLKELQRRLTCVTTPWVPPPNRDAARIINEIVLGEESDEVVPHEYTDHFSLYLRAMGQLGADTSPIERLVAAVRDGRGVEAGLADARIAASTATFVRTTMTLLERSTPELAAAFLYGREDVVPGMFTEILAALDGAHVASDIFRLYLERHIKLDAEEHGPHAELLLAAICGDDASAWRAAAISAEHALRARAVLWDGVLAQLEPHG